VETSLPCWSLRGVWPLLPLPTFGVTSLGFLFPVPVSGWSGWETFCWWSKIWLVGRLDRRQRQGFFVHPNLSVRCQDRRLSRDNWFWCDFQSRNLGSFRWGVSRENWTLSGCGFWIHCLSASSTRVLVCAEYSTQAGLLPACLTGVPAQSGLPGHGQLRDLVQRNEASVRLGPFTKYSTRLSTTHNTHRHLW